MKYIPRGKQKMINLTVNGKSHSVDVEPDTPLLWVIRDNIGMMGTKYGCGIAQCGACTVHIDGQAVRSCGMTAGDAAGKKITTIEGLAENGVLTKVQKAWVEHDVPHCGTSCSTQAFCTLVNTPFSARPSMVVIFLPAASPAVMPQERTAWPSMCTVQAPHCAIPQPYLVPIMPMLSRITQSSGVSGSTSTLCDFPLTVRLIIFCFPLGMYFIQPPDRQ